MENGIVRDGFYITWSFELTVARAYFSYTYLPQPPAELTSVELANGKTLLSQQKKLSIKINTTRSCRPNLPTYLPIHLKYDLSMTVFATFCIPSNT